MQARELRESLQKEGYDYFYEFVPSMKETYPKFSEFLTRLADTDCSCRSGIGGPPDCKIRECARQRKIDVCPFCEDFPCSHIEALAESYTILIQEGKRMKKIGVEKWIEEQEERARRGFVYADIRCER